MKSEMLNKILDSLQILRQSQPDNSTSIDKEWKQMTGSQKPTNKECKDL